jgi:serine protease Do
MRALFVALLTATVLGFTAQTPSYAQTRDLPDFADLVEKVGPGVVNIRTTARVRAEAQASAPNADELNELFQRFFGVPMPRQNPGVPRGRGPGQPQTPEREVPRGVGSGFILSADGYVLTNAHVVDGANEIYVTLTDKREFKGRVVGLDKRTDVALVKVEASGLPKLNLGESRIVRVGQWVLAIGSPFGLENTVTAGIVSAKARETGEYLPFIQTDVAVNPGNSGGPLINMRGEVIGINSQILSESGGSIGISFAIPIDEAMRVVEQLKSTGRVSRGRLGVQIGEVAKDVAEALGLAKAEGALVGRVEPGTPADKAGIVPGDIILRFNGKTIERYADLPRAVGETRPGTRSTLHVWRKGTTLDIPIVVSEVEADATTTAKAEVEKAQPGKPNALGLTVSDLNEEKRRELRISGGVQVDAAEGAAGASGLRRGDIILGLNNTDVTSARQFNELAAKLDPKRSAFVLVRRGDAVRYLPIRPR